MQGDYEPSSVSWVRDQVATYEASDGVLGGADEEGRRIIMLTTRGARSNKLRKTPLMRVEHDSAYAVVASLGGAPENPLWFHNVVAHPLVSLQDGGTRHDLLARQTEGIEREAWCERAVAAYPPYADCQRGTDRLIPIFVLERPSR
ncbi:nitroreductase family deazaflavin-dependent oxidoreductase [soil metagenome]